MMTTTDQLPDNLLHQFNRLAGVNYCMSAMHMAALPASSRLDSPLLVWLLVSEEMLHTDINSHSVIERIKNNIDNLTRQIRAAGFDEWADQFDTIRWSWTFWLALILLSHPKHRKELWNHYIQTFFSNDQGQRHQLALAEIFYRLLSDYLPDRLYDPSSHGDIRFESPRATGIVNLGQVIKTLEADPSTNLQDIFKRWRGILRENVLKQLPGQIEQGIAPEDKEFEDMVLSILTVAGWLSVSNFPRVIDMFRSLQNSPNERLTNNQIALCAALYGYLEGYQRVGSGVSDPGQRRLLSSRAFLLSRRQLDTGTKEIEGLPDTFYLTQDGTLVNQDTFCSIKMKRTVTTKTSICWNGGKDQGPYEEREEEFVLEIADGVYDWRSSQNGG
jgi:hypothetical protein